jgi:hypothetical protein
VRFSAPITFKLNTTYDVTYDEKTDWIFDPSRPDMVHFKDIFLSKKQLKNRKLKKILNELLAAKNEPLFGIRGFKVSYYVLSGGGPSVALAKPEKGPYLIIRSDRSIWIRFGYGTVAEELPLTDDDIASRLKGEKEFVFNKKSFSQIFGFKPRLLVAALCPPKDGYCSKVICGILA